MSWDVGGGDAEAVVLVPWVVLANVRAQADATTWLTDST